MVSMKFVHVVPISLMGQVRELVKNKELEDTTLEDGGICYSHINEENGKYGKERGIIDQKEKEGGGGGGGGIAILEGSSSHWRNG